MPRTHAADLRQAVIGILSRPGGIEQQADEICAAVARVGKKAAAETTPKCQAPDDLHTGTALVGGQCPICRWRAAWPSPRPPSAAPTSGSVPAATPNAGRGDWSPTRASGRYRCNARTVQLGTWSRPATPNPR